MDGTDVPKDEMDGTDIPKDEMDGTDVPKDCPISASEIRVLVGTFLQLLLLL